MVEVGKEVLVELLDRVKTAKKPDPELDARIVAALLAPTGAFVEQSPINGVWCIYSGTDSRGRPRMWDKRPLGYEPSPTTSIDAAVSLVEKVLPGWWWKVGTCCVSDDACIAPDFNSPVHGERLHRQFGPIVSGSEIDAGYDVDRRPPGNVPLALLESLLRALLAQAEKEAG